MFELISNTITFGITICVILTFIGRFLPNDKIHSWGFTAGQFFNSFGSSRLGNKSWEKIEDFLINSVGEYLRGIRDGLNDDPPEE